MSSIGGDVREWSSRSLAASLRHDILEGLYPPGVPFPSCREIAQRYNVGARLARNAMRILADEKLVYTRERQGTFVNREARRGLAPGDRVRCVNIVERREGTVPAFNRDAYLSSYAEVLESHRVRQRIVRAPRDEAECKEIFAPDIPLRDQACLLMNVADPVFMAWMDRHNAPYVVQYYKQYRSEGLPPHHSVIVNKIAGGFEATNYLLGLGHRRIGFIGTLPDDPLHPAGGVLNVFDGFASALKCAALEWTDEFLMGPTTNDDEVALEKARVYLSKPRLPTAVLTQTDCMAVALLRVARETGLRVPDDLSVIGFDGLEESALANPPLTTVAVPRRILARESLEALLRVAQEGGAGWQRKVLPCQLVVRKSAGPAPGAAPR